MKYHTRLYYNKSIPDVLPVPSHDSNICLTLRFIPLYCGRFMDQFPDFLGIQKEDDGHDDDVRQGKMHRWDSEGEIFKEPDVMR